MSRIASRFQKLGEERRKALIPFMTAGNPHPDHTVSLMHALVAAGSDIIELGVPFSDPMADGPVIQRSSELALEFNLSLRGVMAMVSQFRKDDSETPVVLMGYLNPIEVMGYGEFARQAEASGVDGVLIVDLPPEESEPLLLELKQHEIDPIFLIAPTTSKERMATIANHASGFIYYVSMKGITGAGGIDYSGVESALKEIREVTNLPLGVGFGIKDGDSAAAVAAYADAVVVGSALVKRLMTSWDETGGSGDRLKDVVESFISQLRTAMDR